MRTYLSAFALALLLLAKTALAVDQPVPKPVPAAAIVPPVAPLVAAAAVKALPTDPSVQYLKAPLMVMPVDPKTNERTTAGTQVCLPAGAPIIFFTDNAHKAENRVLLDAALVSGWGATYTDLPIKDCRDNSTVIDASAIYVAEATPQSESIANVPDSPQPDATTFKSGYINFPLPVNSVSGGTVKQVCLPRDTRISVWEDAQDKARAVIILVDKNVSDCSGNQTLSTDPSVTYYVATRDVAAAITSNLWTTGVLIVPFKYYIAGDKSFAPSITVGGYLGYKVRWSSTGTEDIFAVFAGPSSISAPANSSTTSSSTQNNTYSGMSYGFGLFTSLADHESLQAGIVYGWDRVNKSTNWVNNGKGWIAAQIGYAFF